MKLTPEENVAAGVEQTPLTVRVKPATKYMDSKFKVKSLFLNYLFN
jgi:hypothetical protein